MFGADKEFAVIDKMDLPDFQNARKWWEAFNKWPLKYRILVVIIIVVIVFILVSRTFLLDFFSTEKSKVPELPMFIVTNPNIRVGSNTLIVAENSSANLNRLLKVEYDGIVFPTGGTPISGSDPQMWHFTLYDKELPEHMLKEGTHELRFSFFGGEFSDVSKIIISNKAIIPFIELPEIDVSSFEDIEIQTIQVHTSRGLIRAIKPNTIIRLAKGTYNLSIASDVKNKYVEWIETYDGFEPLIHSIYNLTLVGEKGSKILIEPSYAWAMNFQNSKNIKIDNVIIGHAVGGYCEGGVLSFVNSEDIEINNSVLFGCGTTGIQIDKVDHLRFVNSTIKDCTYSLLGIFNSTNIYFEKSTFENTGKFNLIEISDFTYNVKFSNCIIRNNWNDNYKSYLIEIGEDTTDISLIGSKIIGNKTKKFINQIDRLAMADNTFLDNSFSDFSGEYKIKN